MNYVVRSVHQLSAEETQQYVRLFNKTFDKELTVEGFYYKFSRQFGETSYFAFMVDEREGIAGSVGAIEVPYSWCGRSLTFALTVDGMIDDRYRGDFLSLKRLHDLLTAELAKRRISFIFTKPNQNSYLYLTKVLGLKDLGNLGAHVFPLRLFRPIGRRLSCLDAPWLAVIGIASRLKSPFRESDLEEIEDLWRRLPPESRPHVCRRRDGDFLRRRYGSPAYGYARNRDTFVIYSVRQFESRCGCFIMESSPLSVLEWAAFAHYVSVRHRSADAILQVDSERRRFPFIRVPFRLLPDKFKVIGKVLDAEAVPADITFAMRLADFEVV